MERIPGLLRVHKPIGVTSFEVVQRHAAAVQKKGAQRWPLCHGGTLDPFAHGLLLILSGPATKLFELLHAVPKVYLAEVVWGARTDNGDPGGQVVARGDASALTPRVLEEALRPQLGWREQVPPSTSAKKVGGEPAYRKVHRGEEVTLPPSRVYLHEAVWTKHELPERSWLRIVCRGGYYVRTLARELGEATGAQAHLRSLHRAAIGPWTDPEPDAQAAPDLVSGAGSEPDALIRGPDVLPWARRRPLSDKEVGLLRNGGTVPAEGMLGPSWPLPEGFPDPNAPVLGVHQGLLRMLLREEGGALRLEQELRGGI